MSVFIIVLGLVSFLLWRYDLNFLFESYKPIKYNEQTKYSFEKKIQHVYVINMANNPKRYKKISSSLEREGIKYTRFNAIDGYNLKIKSESGESFTGKDLKSGKVIIKLGEKYKIYCPNIILNYRYIPKIYYTPLTAGEFGDTCSQLEIMLDIVNKGYNAALILEDDADIYDGVGDKITKLERYLPNLLKWDIIYAGLIIIHSPYKSFMKFNPVINNPELERITNFKATIWGTHALILNYNGAASLLSEIESAGIYDPIDLVLSRVINKNNINAFFAKNINIKQVDSIADIFIMGRKSGIQHQKQSAYLR